VARIAVPVPNLIQGVSQQAETMRFATQADAQENAFPSIADGLTKRHPFDHVAQIIEGGYGDPKVHFIHRDAAERYAVLLQHKSVRVFELGGIEVPVKGAPADPQNPDFTTYLNLLAANLATNPETFLTTWTAANAVAPAATGVFAPLGYGAGINLGSAAGAAVGTYTQVPVAPNDDFSASQTFSIFARQSGAGATQANGFRLALVDTSNAIAHEAVFTWSGGVLSVASTVNGATAVVTDLSDGWYRASVSFVVGAVGGGATGVGNGRSIRITCNEFSGATAKIFLAWGAHLSQTPEAEDYLHRPDESLKALTIADYTLVLNTLKTAAQGAATTAAALATRAYAFVKAGNYKTNYRVTVRRVGGSTQTVNVSTFDGAAVGNSYEVWSLSILTGGTAGNWTVTILGQTTAPVAFNVLPAIVGNDLRVAINNLPNVSAGGSGANITITGDFSGQSIDPSVTPATGGAFTLTETTPNTAAELASIKTDGIAQLLTDRINALADGFTAVRAASVVRIENAAGLDVFEVHDSRGDTNLSAVWAKNATSGLEIGVPDIDDLPLTCDDGYRVSVNGDTEEATDDYYVKFVGDVAGAFGKGRWVETNGFGIVDGLDASTMPWQLIRKQDDAGGTVTGIPFGKYFEWNKATWNTRDVGDNDSAPMPSLVGKTISDVFFFQNRLGMTAGQNVVMSEAGRYFNLFRTTVLQLLDSDPIDVAVLHTSVVTLNHAVPFNERLVLFTDFTQFVLHGDPILSPKTVQVAPVLEYENSRLARPVVTQHGVFFAHRRGDYSGVYEMYPAQQVAGGFDTDDVTAAVPKYIAGDVRVFAPSSLEDILIVAPEGARSSLFVYKYYYAGEQKLQSAWSVYTLGNSARVLGLEFFENTLYVVMQREDGVHLEASVITTGRVDPGSAYITHLDRRFSAGPGSTVAGSFGGGQTTWTLPYAADAAETVQVVVKATGAVYTASVTGGSTAFIAGDFSAVPVWIGTKYTMRYRFSKPALKRSTGSGGKVLIAAGRYQIMRGRVVFDKSAYFRVEVTPLYRPTTSAPFGAATGPAVLASGEHGFGVYSKAQNATIEIVNDSPLPSNFGSAEWDAEYTTQSAQFQG
jgi:hypothetical protein